MLIKYFMNKHKDMKEKAAKKKEVDELKRQVEIETLKKQLEELQKNK